MRVNIKKRIKVGSKWTFAAIAKKDGKRLWDHCIVNGKVELHKEGGYYIEWREIVDGKLKRIARPVDGGHKEAEAMARSQAQVLDLRGHGHAVDDCVLQRRIKKASQPLPSLNSADMKIAVEKYLGDKGINSKTGTILAYSSSLKHFMEFMPIGPAKNLTRQDIKITWHTSKIAGWQIPPSAFMRLSRWGCCVLPVRRSRCQKINYPRWRRVAASLTSKR